MAFKIPFVPAKKVSFRGSCPEVFCRKSFLRNFVKFTGKHLHLSPFLIKLQASGNTFCRPLRTPFFTEQLWWLLLYHFRRILCHPNSLMMNLKEEELGPGSFGSTVKVRFKGDTVTMKEIIENRCDETGKHF